MTPDKPVSFRNPRAYLGPDIFERYEKKASLDGIDFKTQGRKSLEWFRSNVVKSRIPAQAVIKSPSVRYVNKLEAGKLYLYGYDAKTKKKLPYFDRYPLIIPYAAAIGGWYGINFHYLDYRSRLFLFSELLKITNNKRFDKTTRIKAKVALMGSLAKRVPQFYPCSKRYLMTQVRSRIVEIQPEHWPIAVFLPVASFTNDKGATISTEAVWKESLKKIRERKW